MTDKDDTGDERAHVPSTDDTQVRPRSKPPTSNTGDHTVIRPVAKSSNTSTVKPQKQTIRQSPQAALTDESTRIRTSTVSVGDQSGVNPRPNTDPTTLSKQGITDLPTEGVLDIGTLKDTKDYGRALTRIREVVRDQDSSRGYAKAQRAADKALSSDKFKLNNRFVLEKILGAGGMGTVYRARDIRKIEARDINPYVAVKVLNDDFKNHPDAFVTLQREASRSHTLAHPNIVTVHDFDRDGDIIYMTMELLEGQPLDALLKQHKDKGLEAEQALSIIADISKALIYAHHKHIIHSDLKPGNVFITEAGAKVLDFGTARIATKAMSKGDFDAGTLGALTPAYASLEMLSVDTIEETHPADDVYAAGLMAYELLAGHHPYDRKPADKALIENLKPKRIPGLSKRQWSTLDRAIKLRRSDRLQTMDAFYDGLINKSKLPVFKFASVVLLCVIGWFGYDRYFVPDEITRQTAATYQKAQACFEQADFDCAVKQARVVNQLDPEHTQAIALLGEAQTQLFEQKITRVSAAIDQCLSDQDIDCAKQQLGLLGSLAPGSETYQAASDRIVSATQSLSFNELLTEAKQCLSKQQYRCAKDVGNQALAIEPDNSVAKKVVADADAALAGISKNYRAALAKANRCFQNRQFECAVQSANQALKYSNTSEAGAIKKKAEYAIDQRNNRLAIARKTVSEGKACFAKKSFTCAQAKAESALDLVPGYRPAMQLKADSIRAIEQAINNISIN